MEKLHLNITTKSQGETEKIGEIIGSQLKGGECIELIADLGGGKTTLTRGIVKGAGSEDHVSSPTFTISKIYDAPKFNIHHFDFYRLSTAGVVGHELEEVRDEPTSVLVVEWGDIVSNVLPKDRVTISITQENEDTRKIELSGPKKYEYLFESIKV